MPSISASEASDVADGSTAKVSSGDQVEPDLLVDVTQRANAGPLHVLLVDRDPDTVAEVDLVLGADARVQRAPDAANQGVGAGGGRVRGLPDADLLGTHADVYPGPAGQLRRGHPHDARLVQADDTVLALDALGTTSQQVAGAQEPGHEPGRRTLIQLLGRRQLLISTAVHDRHPVGHGHGLFLVVGHVDEGDAHVLLDTLELHLHLLAQLQVERAEGLVQKQHGWPVDERPRERHTLRLATRDLARLALVETAQLHQLQHLRHPAS